MNLWTRMKRAWRVLSSDTLPPPHDDFWYGEIVPASASGEIVTPTSSMRIIAVFACVRLIAYAVAQLPQFLYRRLERGKERATDHYLYKLLHNAPNAWQTPSEFKAFMTGCMVLRGNAYAGILPGPSGFADQLVPIHPDRVKPEFVHVGRAGYMRYQVRPPMGVDGEPYELLQPEMLHLRSFSLNGLVGVSPVGLAREGLGIAVAAEKHAGRYLAHDSRPGVLSTDDILDPEVHGRLKEDWAAKHGGGNRYKPIFLEQGLKWSEIGMTNREAQFIETQQFTIEQIARLFGVQPHKIGHLQRSTNNNIEHQGHEFKSDTIGPYLTFWDEGVSRALILDRDQYFAEFLAEKMLRADSKARAEFYRSAIESGWMTRNEVRERENLNPLPGLDEPLQPMNFQRATEGKEQDEDEDQSQAQPKDDDEEKTDED